MEKHHYPHLFMTFRTVMLNIVFDLGFSVNREALNDYIQRCTRLNLLLDSTFGCTSVNIKFPSKRDNKTIKTLEYKDLSWIEGWIDYPTYLTFLDDKRKQREKKQRHNTFLVFYSGRTIMSGMNAEFMKHIF